MAGDTRYEGREWSDAESDLRSGYGEWSRGAGYKHDESAWDKLKDNVREAWEKVRGRR